MNEDYISLKVGGNKFGAPLFTMTLGTWVLNGMVTGTGTITHGIYPTAKIFTFLSGRLTEIGSGLDVETTIKLTGHVFQGITPPNPVNVKDVLIQYTAGRGTARYAFRHPNGTWETITNALVEVVEPVLQVY
ncbi:hypothetical protein [Spirosoma sp. KNUC1025]|uniref:hypothetical protein n=1 Tax=Spirosoma sp. KNUC1025 TaxID=2894082 RepID=UPI00386AAE24|nr:DUF1842 domain-containing protein [Spirosoma sp. KNUC1025]